MNGNEYQRRVLCPTQPGAVRPSALHVRQHGMDAGRTRADARSTSFNRERNKLFFFWSQDILARTDPGELEPAAHADGARAQGQLLADVRQSDGPGVHPRSASCRATAAATAGGPACFPNNMIPAESDRSERPGAAESVPGSRTRPIRPGRNQYNYIFQTVQDWPRNDQVLRVDWNIAAEHDVLRDAAVRLREACRRRLVARLDDGGWPQQASEVRDRHLRHTSTRCCTPSARRCMASSRSASNWAHQHTSPLRRRGA